MGMWQGNGTSAWEKVVRQGQGHETVGQGYETRTWGGVCDKCME